MMEILKPGKKLFGTYICDVCGCEFKAALHECSHGINWQETRIAFAECPNCKVLCEKKTSEFEEEPGVKLYSCNRCTAIWKCERQDNKFGSIQDYNGDPDILCPFCGSNDTKEED